MLYNNDDGDDNALQKDTFNSSYEKNKDRFDLLDICYY